MRSGEGIEEGFEKLARVREAAREVDVRPSSEGYGDLVHALDLRASLAAAEATLLGAIERRETRGAHNGAHNRSDCPELDPALGMNLTVWKSGEGLEVTPEPVSPVPEYLSGWTDAGEEVQLTGRLLE